MNTWWNQMMLIDTDYIWFQIYEIDIDIEFIEFYFRNLDYFGRNQVTEDAQEIRHKRLESNYEALNVRWSVWLTRAYCLDSVL